MNEGHIKMSKRIAFSLGCLHFAYTKGFPFDISCSEYEIEIRDLLNKIEAVEHIEILSNSDFNKKGPIEGPISLTEGDYPVPYPMGFELNFKLFIPMRFQEDICKKYSRKPETFTEHFNVIINYEYHSPVCFIECIDPSEIPQPSTAISIIKDFLNDRISQIDDRFELQRLGPTPFHANFYLLEHNTEDSPPPPKGDNFWEFISNCLRMSGYDLWMFYYNPKEFDDINEAQNSLYYQLSNEASVYYMIERHQSQSLKEWERIEDLSGKIFQGETISLKRKMLRLVTEGSQLEKLVLRLSKFESEKLLTNTIIQKAITNVLNVDRAVFLDKHIHELNDSDYHYPSEQLMELIKFFDSQRTRIFNSIAVIFAAIVGGVTGTLLTIFYSKP